MAHKFLHVGCMYGTFPKTPSVDLALNSSGDDWIRYAANNWVVWTERSPGDVFTIVRPALGLDDQVMIIEINARERHGWLSTWIWEWMDKKLQGQESTLQDVINQIYPGAIAFPQLGIGGLAHPSPENPLAAIYNPPKPKK